MISKAHVTTRYNMECHDKNGNLKWKEEVDNLVTTEGLNYVLNVAFKSVASVDPWYVGLKRVGVGVAADTLASHASWAEVPYAIATPDTPGYSGNRKELILGAVSGGSVNNVGNRVQYTFTGTDTVAGAFICGVSTTNAGTLYSVADFLASRDVLEEDVLTITVTLSAVSV